jgi:hypothetical protein
MNTKTFTKLAAGIACACLMATAQATTITFLGTVVEGIPPANDATYLTDLLGVSLGGTGTGDGQTFHRSSNADPGDGSTANAHAFVQTDPSIAAPGSEYVVAHYGGKNSISAVWYLGGNGFDIPNDQNALLALIGSGFGIQNDSLNGGYSGYTVFGNTTNVPDGGATVALLGLGMLGVAAIRRKVA